MKAFERVIRGSAVAWLHMGVNFGGQILLVPILLSHWNSGTYGVWLALQAFIGLLHIFSFSYQTYLQGEFLKIGRENQPGSRALFWSAIPTAFLLSVMEFLAFILVYKISNFDELLGATQQLDPVVTSRDLFLITASYCFMNLCFMPFGGLAVKLLTVYGYFARVSIWGLVRLVATLLATAGAVICDVSFLTVGLVWVAAHFITAAFGFADIIILMKRENLIACEKLRLLPGIKALWYAQAVTLRNVLNAASGNGVRILLSAYVGAASVASFSTNRTVANVLRQGIGSIGQPLLPELMHAANRRDQESVEACFSLMWLLVIFVFVPGFLILQLTVGRVFAIWTQGKIDFDPLLFGVFSSVTILFALSQPAVAIVTGNNLLRVQLSVAISSGVVLLSSLVILVQIFGVHGAAYALLFGELIALIGMTLGASKWMHSVGLVWPKRLQVFTGGASLVAATSLLLNSQLTSVIAWGVVVLCVAVCYIIGVLYFQSLPQFYRQQIFSMVPKRLSRLIPFC